MGLSPKSSHRSTSPTPSNQSNDSVTENPLWQYSSSEVSSNNSDNDNPLNTSTESLGTSNGSSSKKDLLKEKNENEETEKEEDKSEESKIVIFDEKFTQPAQDILEKVYKNGLEVAAVVTSVALTDGARGTLFVYTFKDILIPLCNKVIEETLNKDDMGYYGYVALWYLGGIVVGTLTGILQLGHHSVRLNKHLSKVPEWLKKYVFVDKNPERIGKFIAALCTVGFYFFSPLVNHLLSSLEKLL